MPSGEPLIRDDPLKPRYEAVREGELIGEISYRREPGRVVLVHTKVAPSEKGTGVGSQLVRFALDDIRAQGLEALPVCPFVAAYIQRHPEYADLVGQDH